MALVARLSVAIAAVALACAPGRPPSELPPSAEPVPAPVLASADSAVAVRQVAISPKTLLRERTPRVEFGFALPEPARVRVEILDEGGEAVHVVPGGARATGRASLSWDGRGPAGALLPPGVYVYRIVARTDAGAELVSANPPFGGGDEILAQRFTHDPESGRIEFVLPGAARVRLRVGLRDFPHLDTPMDWVPLEAGRHSFHWDGLDASGRIRLGTHPELRLGLSAYALAPNALIVRDPSDGFPTAPARVSDYPAGSYRHASDPAAACREPGFRIEFPDARAREGVAVLGESAPVRVTLDAADRAHLINRRFEVMFFVDNVFLFEREDGSSPFTYRLDTQSFAPGPHLLTVNILSYDDHYGVRTVPFVKAGP